MRPLHLSEPSKFHATVYAPSGVIFDDDIMAMTLINELGPFDVLQRHTNFISEIQEKVVIYPLHGEKKEIPITTSIVKISKAGVEIYVGFEQMPLPVKR